MNAIQLRDLKQKNESQQHTIARCWYRC